MVVRGKFRIALTLLLASTLIMLLAGIQEGLCQDWMRMSLLFFSTVLAVFWFMMSLLGLKIDSRFRHIEKIVKEKSDSDRPVTATRSDRKVVHNLSRVIAKLAAIIVVISVPVLIFLAIIAGLHKNWFGLGIHLLACAITAVICVVLAMALAIDVRSERVEELISGDNEG